MKKIIVASSMILLVGFFTANAYAWNGWGGHGYGNGHQRMYSNTGDYQAFYNETAALRTLMAADRAELNALMAGNSPDPKRVRALTEQISKSEIELSNKAQKYNITGMGMGMGMGMGGYGHNYGGCR